MVKTPERLPDKEKVGKDIISIKVTPIEILDQL